MPIFKLFSSLKLTVWLLAFSLVLVFFGTLDQANFGINHTQELYFKSWVVSVPVLELVGLIFSGELWTHLGWVVIPLPAGFTLGALLLINLFCAHFRYFKMTWKKTGIALTHLGVVLLIAGGILSAVFQQESMMTLDEGGPPVNWSAEFYDYELVVIDVTDPAEKMVTSVPYSRVEGGKTVELPHKPFTLTFEAVTHNAGVSLRDQAQKFFEDNLRSTRNRLEAANAELAQAKEARKQTSGDEREALRRQIRSLESSIPEMENDLARMQAKLDALNEPGVMMIGKEGDVLATVPPEDIRGFARRMGGVALAQEETYEQDTANLPAAIVSIAEGGDKLGSWILAAGLSEDETIPSQTFMHGDRRYELGLRFKRIYYPFSLQLNDFIHERYPGTEIPKRFESSVDLINPVTGEERTTRIYMNHPLRYQGNTFYQASFANNDTTSMLQIVRNQSWTLPYWGVGLVFVGLTIHFGISLVLFVLRKQKRKERQEKPAARPEPASSGSAAAPQQEPVNV